VSPTGKSTSSCIVEAACCRFWLCSKYNREKNGAGQLRPAPLGSNR
jgi:hypothetical protein